MSMSIDKTLDRISSSIENQEAKAVHAVRKFLNSIGMKEEFTITWQESPLLQWWDELPQKKIIKY